ncbi:GNAT family N-acetyltransferase [Pontibacter harenae]|uniref:GNAT family N-acetyltransferase n=1 Tax=Pontibacter harenae TaxID=2894083 RepID=UPI001E5BC26E|nr:GNAT family N-acetyltransferase [Pontibacter harenae]MCC9167887.1 GNAT family N-acetyltransferase [Pontibacter harenae]
MQNSFKTNRLLLNPIDLSDADFIVELVNLPDWIKYIGQRHIDSTDAAKDYIVRMIDSANLKYWVVKLQEGQTAIGIITLIKREYLEHHDLGFAFLPEYRKRGYAYEAAAVILCEMKKDPSHTHVLATTKTDNRNSIRLLESLGLQHEKEVQIEQESLLLYSIATNCL